jgi:hypothetical protein
MSEDSGQPNDPSSEPGQAPPPGQAPGQAQPQYNPQTGYPAGQQPPPYPTQYQAQNPQPYPPQYPQPPYAQAPGQPGWAPGHPGFPQYVLPDHPKATSALIVGIISVAGLFTCVLPVLAAPVAWVIGAQARKEIRNTPQRWGGESKATAGMVLGIIGTVLLVLGLIAIAILIAVAVSDPHAFDSDTRV